MPAARAASPRRHTGAHRSAGKLGKRAEGNPPPDVVLPDKNTLHTVLSGMFIACFSGKWCYIDPTQSAQGVCER